MTPNRLIHEKSPYLLQHATNPVDWYPWGPEALEKAKSEDKPIFLSVGYSTCHWCHVMEHESFEDSTIAAYLNEHFVAIKVDREERPDVDALYMTAVQAMNNGQGGWPMSVFLTPDREPFFAGTYFPPRDAFNRIGFLPLLHRIQESWTTQRDQIDTQADRVADFLRQHAAGDGAGGEGAVTDSLLHAGFARLEASFDAREGGFGGAPKFPSPHLLTFLLRYGARSGDPAAARMVETTLAKMAAGGIHDHLGGGFHRYATDGKWFAPHFEKMLYDQAGLALAYLAGWQVSGKTEYEIVLRDLLDYVLRDLGHDEGGFYAAEDADSEGEEGTFYVWSATEIDAVLGEDGPAFRETYRVADGGNWEGKNILHLGAFDAATHARWQDARARLLAVRAERIRPHRDEKIITGWNGFMIEAMARAGAALGETRYVDAARRAGEFVEKRLVRGDRVLRFAQDGAAAVPGYLEDYTFLVRGEHALYEATLDPVWLERARGHARAMDDLFAREDGAFLMAGSDAEELLAPVVDASDGAMPSGNSAAAGALLRLGHVLADRNLRERGERVLGAFAAEMARSPAGLAEMLSAVDFALGPNREVVVAGPRDDATVNAMVAEVRSRYLPNTVLAHREEDGGDAVALMPYLESQGPIDGKVTGYVCRDYACRLPVHDAGALARELRED